MGDKKVKNVKVYDDEFGIMQCDKSGKYPEFEDFQDKDFNYNFGAWGNYGIDPSLWKDENRPIMKLLHYENLKLTEEERRGYLTDRIIASCSSYLERNPITRKYCLCKCVLVNKGLNDISILFYHNFLQYLDLSFNNLTDLTVLSGLPFLTYLDVSYNKLKQLLNFKAPYNLTYVKWSNNQIDKINDISAFWTIKELDLSHNKIEKIEGLENLRYLIKLDLSHNRIKHIEKLNHLNISTLKLQHNEISSFEWGEGCGLQTMFQLSSIYLNHNQLTSLLLFENVISLQRIEMQANYIEDVMELSYLSSLPYLSYLDLTENAVTQQNNYDEVILRTIPTLRYKDQKPVDGNEMIQAQVDFDPNVKVNIGKMSTKLSALSYFKEHNLGISVIPADQPPVPIIMLVGIEGSKTCQLARKYTEVHSEYSVKIEKYTTRPPLPNEEEDDYKFISKKHFQDLLLNGDFLTISVIIDEYYGISHSDFDKACGDGDRVLIVDAYLEEAITIKSKGLRPYLILCMPKCKNKHMRTLMECYQTVIFNCRYPEGAVKVIPRENAYIDDIDTISNKSEYEHSSKMSYIKHIENTLITSSATDENDSNDNFTKCIVNPVFNYSGTNSISIVSLDEENSKTTQEDVSSESNTPHNLTFNSPNSSTNTLSEPCTEEMFKIPAKGSRVSSSWIDELSSDYYKYIMKLREQYLMLHQENPGLFYDVIYTDDTNASIEKLDAIVQVALQKQMNDTPLYDPNKDTAFQEIISERLKIYEHDINKFLKNTTNCKIEDEQ